MEPKDKKNYSKVIIVILFILFAVAVVGCGFLTARWLDNRQLVPKNLISNSQNGTEVKVKLVNGYLDIEVVNIEIMGRTAAINFKPSDKPSTIAGLNIYKDNAYVDFEEEDYKTEKYIGNDPSILAEFDEEKIKEFDWNNTGKPKQITFKDRIETEDDVAINQLSVAGTLYKEGFSYYRHLVNGEYEAETYDINPEIAYQKTYNPSKILDIEGIGKIDLNDLSYLKDKAAISFNLTYDMLYVFDESNDELNLAITCMGNPSLGNDPLKIVQHPDYNNVYYDVGYLNDADYGYRSFSVMTEAGMYYFKMGEYIENADKYMEEILSLMGISKDDEKIDIGYDLILTLDKMDEFKDYGKNLEE